MSFPTYHDDFETGAVDTSLWRLRQILDRQISFRSDAASGAKSIVTTITDGDGGASCSKPCQRAEIRTHGSKRPLHGDEFWQSFAFRASGDIAETGSLRTVLGQWKAPGDQSPFLAQRFDNGVFHITVQEGPNRRVVAAAEGDPDRLDSFQNLVADLSAKAPGVAQSAKAFAELKRASRLSSLEAAPRPHQAKILRQASEALSALEPDDDEALFEEFCFINDIDCFACRPSLRVSNPGRLKLPDPKQDWVRMAYRIKAGRADNDPAHAPQRTGEIDIYANGELIAEVRGDVGYQVTAAPSDPTIYFKFGVYRDLTPGTLRLHFDHFRQGSKQSDVM